MCVRAAIVVKHKNKNIKQLSGLCVVGMHECARGKPVYQHNVAVRQFRHDFNLCCRAENSHKLRCGFARGRAAAFIPHTYDHLNNFTYHTKKQHCTWKLTTLTLLPCPLLTTYVVTSLHCCVRFRSVPVLVTLRHESQTASQQQQKCRSAARWVSPLRPLCRVSCAVVCRVS